MINPAEWDISEKAAAGVTGLLGVALMLQKLLTVWKGESSTQAGADATTKQFKALQESIESTNKALTELRAEVQVMDRTIHKQQRTITRMEMLLRQFSGLVQEHGITVPAHMQRELEDLLKPEGGDL